MKWIVGLGNPGRQYEKTRHNIGFMALDELAERYGLEWKESKKVHALIGEGFANGQKIALLKPLTFMNLSGESVRSFADYYGSALEDMIIVYDDMDTEFGKIRLRYKGSAGGHNGIKSIIQHTGTDQFNRLRMGISRPEPGFGIADYVLSNFTKSESAALPDILYKSANALEFALEHPFEETMAKFNG